MEDENSVEISQKEKSDRKFLLSIDKIERTDRTMRRVNESVGEESISTILSNPVILPFASKNHNDKIMRAKQASMGSAFANLKKFDTKNTARELDEIEEIGEIIKKN